MHAYFLKEKEIGVKLFSFIFLVSEEPLHIRVFPKLQPYLPLSSPTDLSLKIIFFYKMSILDNKSKHKYN